MRQELGGDCGQPHSSQLLETTRARLELKRPSNVDLRDQLTPPAATRRDTVLGPESRNQRQAEEVEALAQSWEDLP